MILYRIKKIVLKVLKIALLAGAYQDSLPPSDFVYSRADIGGGGATAWFTLLCSAKKDRAPL